MINDILQKNHLLTYRVALTEARPDTLKVWHKLTLQLSTFNGVFYKHDSYKVIFVILFYELANAVKVALTEAEINLLAIAVTEVQNNQCTLTNYPKLCQNIQKYAQIF